ncbi:hypothetical protein DW322_00845 [Rhodococcus rhodnii]|uniref:Uncharacterized protein n=2 Tax=Rhodococcus rhodnii TaxID=38312 RepID=R7WPN8_9NOCA|nr:hypothetical protein [Rhodococcus rhodnii]EOM77281.1 hypothetical protein Rrhod_1343 [Rhodococcus rhodnii LMG 5362]TXG88257.1 hypothetical protein DW322_21475 [Rhodococcus rhodnii]TXG89051.1 hypothetical protein DW322_00845 [Rhodococcus rhodnii]
MTDIVDQIGALIDEQLDAGEPRTGFDFGDQQYPKCGHCGRDWHGLAITARMEEMRRSGVMDAEYRHAEDDSAVLCPGSDFIGPMPAPTQREPHRWPVVDLDAYLRGVVGIYQEWLSIGTGTPPARYVLGGDDMIEGAAELHTARVGEALPLNPNRRGTFVPMGRLVAGDRIVIEIGGRLREAVVVDVVERGGEVEFVTEDPSYSSYAAHLARLRDATGFRGAARRATSALSRFAASLAAAARPQDPPELPAVPQPSTEPPMWANDPTRTRRGRTRRSSRRVR